MPRTWPEVHGAGRPMRRRPARQLRAARPAPPARHRHPHRRRPRRRPGRAPRPDVRGGAAPSPTAPAASTPASPARSRSGTTRWSRARRAGALGRRLRRRRARQRPRRQRRGGGAGRRAPRPSEGRRVLSWSPAAAAGGGGRPRRAHRDVAAPRAGPVDRAPRPTPKPGATAPLARAACPRCGPAGCGRWPRTACSAIRRGASAAEGADCCARSPTTSWPPSSAGRPAR